MGRHDSDPPAETCVGCGAWQLARTVRRWSIPLVTALLGALVTLGLTAGTACTQTVETRSRVETMAEAQRAALVERQRHGAEIVELRVQSAEALAEIRESLRSIKAQLDRDQDRDEPPPVGRRRTR